VRKFSAILLICIFAFSQYTGHISYLECKILNTFRSTSLKCDCEKFAGFEKSASEQPSNPRAHRHIHPDDFFPVHPDNLLPVFNVNAIKLGFLNAGDECKGNRPVPWQPPNS
jgi:hypothetical protein